MRIRGLMGPSPRGLAGGHSETTTRRDPERERPSLRRDFGAASPAIRDRWNAPVMGNVEKDLRLHGGSLDSVIAEARGLSRKGRLL